MLKTLNLVAIGFLILALTGCSLPPGYYGKKEIAKQSIVSEVPVAPVPTPAPTLEPASAPVQAPLAVVEEKLPEGVSPGLKKLPVGEQLTFSIRWMGLEAGRTTSTIKEIVKINGRDCYHIEAFSRTTSILDLLFRIRDYHDSYVDCENFYSHRFIIRASEGDHTYDEINDFDYDKNKAYYLNKKKNEHKVTDIPGKVQDIVSVSYWFRTQNVKVGDTVAAVLHSDEKNYDVTIKVLKKDNFRMGGQGRVPMMVIEPKARRGKKLYKKGRAKIWVTDDDVRLPLFAELHVIIAGALNIVLVSHETVNVA
ncbi:MAG: DUF3108 domain-containing protein [Candidatus Omnitrophica bacterium]|nr:DUF3108 domain-containing protein [Candidatus Omnitrophota bacterium]